MEISKKEQRSFRETEPQQLIIPYLHLYSQHTAQHSTQRTAQHTAHSTAQHSTQHTHTHSQQTNKQTTEALPFGIQACSWALVAAMLLSHLPCERETLVRRPALALHSHWPLQPQRDSGAVLHPPPFLVLLLLLFCWRRQETRCSGVVVHEVVAVVVAVSGT